MTRPLTCIIVDDEPDARELVEHLLQRFDHITVMGKAESASLALNLVLKQLPDIIFLDVQMPGKNGFDLLHDLQAVNNNYHPNVVFVTAHDKYAIQAIKHAAFDYLLKPISKTEFDNTISKLSTNTEPLHVKLDKYLQYTHPDNKLHINTRTGYLLINMNDIIYCQADGNYTNIILGQNKKEVATMNLGHTEALLTDNPQFKRAGRSVLLNTNYLYKVDRTKKVAVLEKDGAQFEIEVPEGHLGKLG